MIAAAVIGLVATFFAFLIGLAPSVDVPGWFTSATSAVGTVYQFVGSMGVWFPGATVVAVIGTVFAIKLVGLFIKVARMALSLMTGGGGSAV